MARTASLIVPPVPKFEAVADDGGVPNPETDDHGYTRTFGPPELELTVKVSAVNRAENAPVSNNVVGLEYFVPNPEPAVHA